MKTYYLKQNARLKKSLFYRELMTFLAAYVIVIYAIYVAYEFFIARGVKSLFYLVLTSLFLRLGVSELIHKITKRARPYQKYNFKPVESILFTLKHKPHDSFPSDHMLILAFLATTILPVSGALFWVGVVILPLVGLARLVLGFHYLTDLIAGAALGVIFGIMYNWLIFPLFT